MEDLKKKKNVTTVATVPPGSVATVQNLGEKNGSLHRKGHRKGIASSHIVSRKKSTN